jgi:hypothetical protein
MKIAVLILAHKNLDQLRKLIDHLKTDLSIYVHINKSVQHDLEDESNVKFVKERYVPYWGSDNTPKAMLSLMKEALKDECDYYMIISGQDLPLMKNNELIASIREFPVNYIYHHQIPKAFWPLNGGMDRLTLYWPKQYSPTSTGGQILNFAMKAGWKIVREFQSLTGLKRKIHLEPWGGSMWLNLTRKAVEYVLIFLRDHPEYVSRFRYTRLSDEIFFQSILLGSDFKDDNIIINDDMRFIDWETGPEYPRIFTMDDYDRCVNSRKFFGRKFDEKVDGMVIDKLLDHNK